MNRFILVNPNRTWTSKIFFSEPKPNLNPQNCAQVNPNRTWTPNKSKNIFFPYPDAADAGTRTIRAVVNFNRINNFSFFFSGRNEERQLNFKSMNPNRTWTSNILLQWTWTSKMVLKWTRTKPEPLKYFEPKLNLNPNRYLKRFDILVYSAKSLQQDYWNDRRSRRVFLCFYSAIFHLTSAKFQTFAYNSRTVWSSFVKFWQQFEINELYACTKFRGNWSCDFGFRTRKPPRKLA